MDDSTWIVQILQAPATSAVAVGSLLTVAIFLILRGLLIPKIVVDQIRQNYEDRIADLIKRGDDYRDAWLAAEKRADASDAKSSKKDEQIGKLMDVFKLFEHTLGSIPLPPERVDTGANGAGG